MMATKGKNNPGKCPQKEKDCEKNCFNCPLTLITLIAPSLSIVENAILYKNNFIGYKAKLISEYYGETWKPPKGVAVLA